MIAIVFAAALAAAPAPTPAPAPADHADHAGHQGMKHEGPCCDPQATKDCCKGDKPMPCCAKKAAEKPADGAGTHEHAH